MNTQELSILIVDDVPAARRVLTRLLQKIGYNNVVEAESGQAAILQAQQIAPGLIITDLHLKDMTGIELMLNLRRDPQFKAPFLLVTSDMSKQEFEKAATAGVQEYLLKPFTRDSLNEKLQTILLSKD